MYSECILRRGRDTLRYIQNTSRYTYPHPHTWPDPNASGILFDTTGYDRIRQDTSARPYPRRLHTIPPDTAGIRRRYRICVVFSSLLPLYLPSRPRASKRSASSSLESGSGTCARLRASYRDGILYLDAMPPSWARIHLYSHRTCCISMYPMVSRRAHRDTSKIHRNTAGYIRILY